MNHTPGPWHVGSPPPHMPLNSVFGEDERIIASTGGYSDNIRDPEALRQEQEANARLIASAPDLLEALQEILANPAGFVSGDARWKGDAAIAKATGQEVTHAP